MSSLASLPKAVVAEMKFIVSEVKSVLPKPPSIPKVLQIPKVPLKLRDFIRSVRNCRTAAEERTMISNESAMIRTAIKEEQVEYRHRNVAKLLYMYMLGYPTHFAQVECLKLINSKNFSEKRVGYLAVMLLLSEETELLLLATNSLANDLHNPNPYIVGLALTVIGNLANDSMSRDLVVIVDKHMCSQNPYVRKKAALAMGRILNKVPEMVEDFSPNMIALFRSRDHGVLLSALALVQKVFAFAPSAGRSIFAPLVPHLIQLLKAVSTEVSFDHVITGVNDPFLTIDLLRLLQVLASDDASSADAFHDVLAQLLTKTDASKNAGAAVLYECVMTIGRHKHLDGGLRTLAIAVLGKFLDGSDNNAQYVALRTLGGVIERDPVAVGRHVHTIVACLKDADSSIRHRSLALIYALANPSNVTHLVSELLAHLTTCGAEEATLICPSVLSVVDRLAPTPRWRVDTLITLLTLAGEHCGPRVVASAGASVTEGGAELRMYATHRLARAVKDDGGKQEGLALVAVWCVGENGDLLLERYQYETLEDDGSGGKKKVEIVYDALEPNDVITLVENVAKRDGATEATQARALTCYAKLTERFAKLRDEGLLTRLRVLIRKNRSSKSVELQTRSIEYSALVSEGCPFVGQALVRMPVVDQAVVARAKAEALAAKEAAADYAIAHPIPSTAVAVAVVSKKQTAAPIVDLMDLFGGGSSAPAQTTTTKAAANTNTTANANANVNKQLDIFSSSGQSKPAKSDFDALTDIFATQAKAQAQAPQQVDMFAPAPLFAPPQAQAFGQQNFGGGFTTDVFASVQSAPAPAPAPPTQQTQQTQQMQQMQQFSANPMDAFASMPSAAPAPAPFLQQQPLPPIMDAFAPAPSAPAPPLMAQQQQFAPAPSMPVQQFTAPQPDMFAPAPPPPAPQAAFGGGPMGTFPPSSSSSSLPPFQPSYPTTAPFNPPPPADVYGQLPSSSTSPPPVVLGSPLRVKFTAFSEDGLSIDFECVKSDPNDSTRTDVTASFRNETNLEMSGLAFQAAVPKYLSLELSPPTSTVLAPASNAVTQLMKISNSQLGSKKIMLKLRISYVVNGQRIEKTPTANNFPDGF